MKQQYIFSDNIEQEALNQFNLAMAQPCVVKGALMPDAHAGYTLPIGAVIATEGVIFPSYVGYDIGCGVAAVRTSFSKDDVQERAHDIFERIYEVVPVGFSHRKVPLEWVPKSDYTPTLGTIFKRNGRNQLGTLGGGNHFIEIGYDERDRIWVICHSGSRGIGHAVATHYMKLASGDGKAREGHFGLSVDSEDGQNYIKDLAFCLEFALENRKQILGAVGLAMGEFILGALDWSLINRNHNHAELKDGLCIHRKGATHAEGGMLGVIPGNMRDGSFIVEGLGNPDSLCSSSHGAGRVMGRKEAQRKLNMQDFSLEMQGIEARVKEDTLDESPKAYKDIFQVMRDQRDLVRVLHHVRPIINIKG